MTRPDLSDPTGRTAYRRELRRVAVPWRAAGFALVLGGTAAMIWYGRGPQSLFDTAAGEASVAVIAAGWALLIVAIVKRTRYHKTRMTGE
jgi:hypothetical protein